MSTQTLFSELSDRDLLEAVSRAAVDERHATVDLVRLVRQLPTPTDVEQPPPDLLSPATEEASRTEEPRHVAGPAVSRPSQPLVTPRSPGRYLLRVTISSETHAKLRQARDLLRHAIPDGDPAAILDRALTLLVHRLEREKAAITSRPRASRTSGGPAEPQSGSRRIPAAVRREVWIRDQGRCAFEGPHGRCRETGRLEFHHIVPFASGGRAEASNMALRCRAHN
jgi:hypothetical protein